MPPRYCALKIAALMDDVAEQMAREGVEAAVKGHSATLADDERYKEDQYKFNPFGVASIGGYKL
ncbi:MULTISPECIES: hypothetical protein [Agrobacterium]|jgi:hypothetical protein|uniref:Uncharacterized protein n=2 Tax=Agrobacterium tumefaciens complex TaxID=1183400 RepID=A0AAW8LYW8_AGRTU|nr:MULTISPECIES: hypothetical protein [Agrobacterium]TGE77438.1 hypothetical protein C9410_20160 [Rhizobium sp. SEMIA 439]CUX37808.1 hypothetical protein AGR4B_Lc20133 [Agrobacterium tumefaciens str. CFBP 5621]KAA1233143.1 hypothetical protein FHL81_16910 [Agrobacterium tumefaciens]KAB0456222.1 hypothetical protein F7R04_25030 [Agrobacterium tumefaciens]KWT79014.1 hypothetical protein ASH09_22965 [Agrobacterium radiobacter]